jgi:hypothetical protein
VKFDNFLVGFFWRLGHVNFNAWHSRLSADEIFRWEIGHQFLALG